MKLLELKKKFIEDFNFFFSSEEELLSQFWMLSENVFSKSRLDFALNQSYQVSKNSFEKFETYCKRLKNNEPIQYIIGQEYFRGMYFLVNKNVLIPRPETEELVNWVLADNDDNITDVLDIATGSGCIAISIKKERKNYNIEAVDISENALKVAMLNNNLIGNTVKFKKADATNLEKDNYYKNKKWDIIISNPPYVLESEKQKMKSNVLEFEPHLALFVDNNNPLIFYKKILEYSINNLKNNGIVYFEINENMEKDMCILAETNGFDIIEVRKDFRGKVRMMKLKKRPTSYLK